jgi:hypothetical protein
MAKNPRDNEEIERTKSLMGALVRMKPKPHEDMKIGKKAAKRPPKRSKQQSKP